METTRTLVGWREWAALPELGIEAIKVKVDTGARTSALHAFHVSTFQRGDSEWVRFHIHPFQDSDQVRQCEAPLLERRVVSDSGGHREQRPVIRTALVLGQSRWPVEITLTDRETMKFRMLLGRTAMKHLVVQPDASFLLGGDRYQPAEQEAVQP